MSQTNRKVVRQAVSLLFQEALVGEDKPLQAFFDHEVGDWGTQNPIGYLTGRGSRRHDDPDALAHSSEFALDLHVWVRYIAEGVTEADSENTLDDIEQLVAETIQSDGRVGGVLSHDGESLVDALEIGGVEYRHETIPLRVALME